MNTKPCLDNTLIFFGCLLLLCTIFFLFYPTPLSISYYSFSDTRPFFSIPNSANILSNLGFLLIGLLGLHYMRKDKKMLTSPYERGFLYLFFLGLCCISLGSSYFHYALTPLSLLSDRLPLALTFTALFSFLIIERINPSIGLIVGPFMIIFGMGAAIYWYLTHDIRLYLLSQAITLISVPLLCLLFPSSHRKDRYLLLAASLYLLALLFDYFDKEVFVLMDKMMSGHTIKHLLSAVASGFLLFYLLDRKRKKERLKN